MSKIMTKKGVSIPAHQHVSDFIPKKTETVIIPSTNQPSFGSMFTIDIRELNVIIHNLCLQFNLSAISVMTSGSYVPAQFLVDHIDYVMNGAIAYTAYPLDQFLQAQLFQRDEDRLLMNIASGSYNSATQRQTMASGVNSYYLPLFDFFKQAKSIPLLENAHNVQLRIFMQPLVSSTIGTGTATASINSCNLLMNCTRLREEEANMLRQQMYFNKASHFKFNDLKVQSYTVNSGVSATNIVMSAITGPISFLVFVVRPSASLTGAGEFAFTAISQYEILNSAGQNIVGGQPISNSQALLVLGNANTRSSYLAETALGITNNNANVYVYSFGADCSESASNAVGLGNYKFTGSEQLKLTFTGSLGASTQVDILAYTESLVSFTKGSVKKSEWH